MTKRKTLEKKKKSKVADAGYRVLESLSELVKRPVSTQEILLLLEEKTDKVYRKEVINKYLNTLKLLNIELVKVKEQYYLEHGLERIEYNEKDLSLLEFIKKYVTSLNTETFKDTILESLQIIEKSFSINTCEIIKNTDIKPYKPVKQVKIKDVNVKKFEKYCLDHQKAELVYKESSDGRLVSYRILPLNVVYKKGRAFLVGYCYSSNSYKEFVIENIIESKQEPQKSYANSPSAVTFKLTGRLAKSYVHKKGDVTIEQDLENHEYIIISNKIEDKDLLLRRLIRYVDSCEILYPKVMREKMLLLVKEMEEIYAG